jgi:hypothetical protein
MKLLTLTSVLIIVIIISVLIIRFSSQVIDEADELDNQPD